MSKSNEDTRTPAAGSHGMIVKQPGQQRPPGRVGRGGPVFMVAPAVIPGIPPGLEYLASVSSISVHQIVEMLEVFTGIETRNRYSLCNELGQQVYSNIHYNKPMGMAYFAYEESSWGSRICLGNQRNFTMVINDNFMQPVMLIHRPYSCCAAKGMCGYLCSDDSCIIEAPPGNQIGRVLQQSSCCDLEYMVTDMSGNGKLFIRGPSCVCCEDIDYKIFAASNPAPIGAITKQWGGLAKEMFTDADSFILNFPFNLDVHLKAALLGATFLIDFIAHEKTNNNNGF